MVRVGSGERVRRDRATALVALVLTAGCATGTATDHPGEAGEGARAQLSVTMSFGQLSSQVGTTAGLIRVVNTGRADLPVTGVGLDWPAYGPAFLAPKDRVVPPAGTVDFPVTLPPPECADAPGAAVGVVRAGDSRLRQELDGPGQELLRRVRRQACEEQLVHERVGIRYGDSWRADGAGRHTSILGELLLSRREGNPPVRIVHAQGSVLYDLELPHPSTLEPGARTGRTPLRIRPGNRCDEHARSQATAPFTFRFTVRIGEETARVTLLPPPGAQEDVTAILERACG